MLSVVKVSIVLLFTIEARAQNLENIGKGDAFALSGGINTNMVFYHASGIEQRREPFNYFLSGNLNISIYDWSIPLSFSYSDQNSTFQQPFNQYGLSPTYKWITLHAGYRSMVFSDYTMNGHLFLGGGFEVAPTDKVKVSGFYGRLQKAVPEDTTDQANVPIYQRMGGGFKVTVGDQKNFFDVIAFRAKDDVNSLPVAPVASDVNPEENVVLGFNFGSTLFERLSLKGEVASSAISKNVQSEKVEANNPYDRFHFVFQPRASSSYYQAYRGSLQYSFSNAGVGFLYERVDPGYRTLGAYYFNNNLENFSLTNSAVFLHKKARVNARIGVQRNNLDNKELSSMNRLSGSVNVNYLFSPRLVSNVSYSSFTTVVNFRSQFDYINQVSPYENLDTLNYRQVAQNANASVNYVLSEQKERRQNLSVSINYQKTSDQQADIEQPTGAQFYNLNSSYSIVLSERNLTINVAANANFTETLTAKNRIYGPSTSVRKTFFDKKLSATATVSYNNSYMNNQLGSRVTNLRLNGVYTVMEKHQFNAYITQANWFSPQSEAQPRFNELTIQLGYNYNFSL